MLQLDLSEFERIASRVQDVERQMPFMLAESLTKAMYEARDAEYQSMGSVFDRPTRYTLNSIRVEGAKRNNLRAELHFKQFGGTPADKYLGPEVRGGPRRSKGAERALQRAGILRAGEYIVPGRAAPLDSHGNVRGSVYTQVLSALGASTDAMQNRTARSKKRNAKLKPFFVMRQPGVRAGVYMRSGRKALPILMFVKQPTYRKRYPFYEVGHQMIAEAMRRQFKAVVGREIARQIKRRG